LTTMTLENYAEIQEDILTPVMVEVDPEGRNWRRDRLSNVSSSFDRVVG
jgi:hypothetical protein